jgi:metallo-beta-lactamase class B
MKRLKSRAILCASLPALCFVLSRGLMAQGGPPSPTPDREAMYQHLKKAQEIAGQDLYAHFAHRCLVDQTYRRTISRSIQATGAIEPLRVFDNLYFVGQNAVSSWAISTSAGIIVIDTLNSAEEARTHIAGGLAKVGLNPADIKYAILTHAHGDHVNGAAYLQDTYAAQTMASKTDWEAIRGLKRGLDIEDGQRLTIGNTTITFYVTPGHTAGTVSMIFSTTDGAQNHVVGMFGGLGTPASAADKKTHIASLARFRTIANAAGVDSLIANHQTQDLSLAKLELLRLRRPGDANPYVVGKGGFLRYLDIQSECTAYAMAREGQR